MNIGIVGLGLIGGSFAKAYHKAGHTVYAYDTDSTILGFSQVQGVVAGVLDEETIPKCDLIMIAVLPNQAIEYFEKHAHMFSPNTIIMDACGTKMQVCEACFEIAARYQLTFIGGHPMAGMHKSGFKNATAELFCGAPMVLVPPVFDDPALLAKVESLLLPAGFSSFAVTTAKAHDEMIAFTSQMPHIISNAFIKSPTAKGHSGFSAGSYKDLTRVAWLNPKMWAELLMNNKEHVINELDVFITEMQKYKTAIEHKDTALLEALLEEGKRCKEEIDG